MRWKGRRQSSNVEDRRAASPRALGGLRGTGGGGGLLRLLPVLLRVLGVKGTLFAAVAVGALLYFGGGDLGSLVGGLDGGLQAPPGQTASEVTASPAEAELVEFVSVVLADTEDTWHGLFEAEGRRYEEPRLVLFRDAVESACGLGQAAMGPFYCPADRKVYLDLGFFDELGRRHGAPGDFAQAYVIAHEVGHHVQTLLGISAKVRELRQAVSTEESNRLSVRQELQADCFAGIWGHHADRSRRLLEEGDVDEALNAASAIGDDRLQRQGRGYVMPESFTHGTSAQRVRWFRVGLESGRLADCNTFAATEL
jgi:predicted metalloprotease